MKNLEFEITYHKNQEKILYESGARFKVIAKNPLTSGGNIKIKPQRWNRLTFLRR